MQFHIRLCVTITKLPKGENVEHTRKNFGYKKTFWTHKIPTRKVLNPQNNHENNFGLTKYPHEKILDPRNTDEKIFCTHDIPTKAQWRDGTRPTKPMMAPDLRNLAHSELWMK